MNVKFVIEATEWKFEETLPFAIEKVTDTVKDFTLPLYDKDGEEKDTVVLPNCRVIELEGEEESFHVVFEDILVKSYEKTELDDDVVEYVVQLAVDETVWQQGEESGIFYSWKNLPEKLKELDIKNS